MALFTTSKGSFSNNHLPAFSEHANLAVATVCLSLLERSPIAFFIPLCAWYRVVCECAILCCSPHFFAILRKYPHAESMLQWIISTGCAMSTFLTSCEYVNGCLPLT